MSKNTRNMYETAWQKLHQYEAELNRIIAIAAVKNPVVTIVFMINTVLTAVLMMSLLVTKPLGVEEWPIVGLFLPLVTSWIAGKIWRAIVFCLVFVGVIPAVVGSLAALVCGRYKQAEEPRIPELEVGNESETVDAKLKEVDAARDRVKTSYGWMFLTTFACAVGGFICYYQDAASSMSLFKTIFTAVLFLAVAIVMWCVGWLGYTVESLSDLEKIRSSLVSVPEAQPEPAETPLVKEEAAGAKLIKETEPQEEEVDPETRRIDPFCWTVDYVANHENECSEIALMYVDVAKELLQDKSYDQAAEALDRVAYALELLTRLPGGATYGSYLYANQYAAARVYAFGLNDREAAVFRLKRAVETAQKYASSYYDDHERSARDHRVMKGVLDDFMSGKSMRELEQMYGTEFPHDIC